MALTHSSSIVTNGLVLCLDAANPRSYSPNVAKNPVDIYGWTVGTNGACTIERDPTVSPSPAGGIPCKMSITGNDPYMATYNNTTWTLAPAKAGETWTVSVYVKSSVASGFAQMFIFGVDNTGTAFNLGGVGASDFGAGNTNFTSTNWVRVSFSYTFSNANVTGVQIRLDGTDSGGAGQIIWWDGLQVEKASSPTTFNSTTNTNGSVWSDVSGYGNHHTLINSPNWAAGKFTLNGTTQGFQRLSAITGVTTTCTVSLWYSTSDTTELWVMGNNNTSYYLSASDSNNYYNSNCGTPTNYVDLSQTTNPTTPINYKNGIYHMWEAKSVDFVTAPWNRYDWYSYPAPWYMAGSASVIMVYNRVLTAAESAQNYAAYRGRYGV